MTKRILPFLSLILATLAMSVSIPAHAEAGLQLNPLKYEDTLATTSVKSGFIDVSNPSDTTITIQTDVQGFRQADLDGNLEFFSDEQLRAGIIPGLDTFELGPRESIRMAFTVNPGKLPQGGVYAAIFFRTVPPPASSKVSYISESANVGTLLILRNGNATDQIGKVTKFTLPFWQFGGGLRGQLQYQNTNRDRGGLAFTPKLESRVLPWGHGRDFTGPFIMPGATRQFTFTRPGSYLGILPVTVLDAATGHPVTRWVFALTGWYQVLLLLVIILGALAWLNRHRGSKTQFHRPRRSDFRLANLREQLRRVWRRLRRKKRPVVKRPMDGLGPRV
jgi:hypothetical protein